MTCDISYILEYDENASLIWVKDRTILKESTGDYVISEIRDTSSYISYLKLKARYESSIYEGIYSCIIHNSNLGHDQILKSFITTASANLGENISEAEIFTPKQQYAHLILFSTIGIVSFSIFSCICCFLLAKYVELVCSCVQISDSYSIVLQVSSR